MSRIEILNLILLKFYTSFRIKCLYICNRLAALLKITNTWSNILMLRHCFHYLNITNIKIFQRAQAVSLILIYKYSITVLEPLSLFTYAEAVFQRKTMKLQKWNCSFTIPKLIDGWKIKSLKNNSKTHFLPSSNLFGSFLVFTRFFRFPFIQFYF